MYLIMVMVISQFAGTGIGNFTPANKVALVNQYASAGFWDILPPLGKSFTLFKLGNSFLNILPFFLRLSCLNKLRNE